ncbi:hypothetical protein [Phycicoccus duodecadis]|uniref:Uncharacterized protein n=1 Tax=Phycicoccus duodecadis TaxID=173053 RepID=A0A2N3YLC8_9MICO|nr:hypothetical protein [Phycicoccus duodecadis]PKW27656.1 hypothetical protein ATL31_2507 [Phycicoccus duodecadis]
MATGGDAAIGFASRLDEINFPEFTCKLVSDVFDALVASNIRQQQAQIELLKETAKTLTTYINDTKDDIGPEEIMQLLSAAAPPADATATSEPSKVAVDQTLTAADATAVNKALEVTGGGVADDNKVATAKKLTQPDVDKIKEAAAIRIAANKYTLLVEMVKLGMLRLVVDNGSIETGLNFRAYGSDYFSTHSTDYSRSAFDFRASAKSGGLVSLWVKASASTAFSTVRVSTTDTVSGNSSGVDVQITGGVKINFHTDYLPLNQA